MTRKARKVVNHSPTLVVGLVHHQDPARSLSQRQQSEVIVRALKRVGFEVIEVEEFEQVLGDPDEIPPLRLRMLVASRLWAHEIHHLREHRRRRGRSLTIPFRKRWQAIVRVVGLIADRGALLHSFRRLEIERALSAKQLRIWNKALEGDSVGAIVFEDDFFLRDGNSAGEVASLVSTHFEDYDLIDLAGGLSRDSLGLPEAAGEDLSLPLIVTNTCCAYFVSRRACEALVNMVASKQELLYLAPDFLINELNAIGFSGSSLLPFELPLIHGSLEGVIDSSIPY